jgi:cell division protein FtsW
MARTLRSDKTLFMLTMLLVGTSLVMVYSASYARAIDDGLSPHHFFVRQSLWALMGFAGMWAAMRTDYRTLRRPVIVWSLLGVSLFLLLAVLIVGPTINGTRRWFAVAGLSFQPSELAKLSAVVFTAALLDRRMHRIDDLSATVWPIGLAVLSLVTLVLCGKDLGTAAVIACVVLAMLFAAGLSYRYLTVGLVSVGIGGTLMILLTPFRRGRIDAFLDPWAHAQGGAYQVVQSMLAIGSGGLFGAGFMEGRQKLLYLPEPHTDFIFAVIGEEFGLLGTTALVLCFCAIIWRGLRISLLAPDRFGCLLALGITLTIGVQSFINMSVTMSLVPTKGIALPFISSGGSSLLLSMVAMGILINISQHAASGRGAATQMMPSLAMGPQEG